MDKQYDTTNSQQKVNQKKSALVTGASRGIGRAISFKLAEAGYDLLLVASGEAGLSQMRQELLHAFPDVAVSLFSADLADAHAAQALGERALGFEPTVLINNVGIFVPKSLLDDDPDAVRAQFNINYFTAHTLCAQIGRQMRIRKDGHIVNITSTASREPVPAGTYTVTKFALRGLTHVLREELRGSGVKVTEIIPGSTWTSSWEGVGIAEQRFANAEEIADAVLFCLRSDARTMIEEIVIKPQSGNIVTDC